MFIKKISICNLFAYNGLVEVDFHNKRDGKNLYMIYGNNGFGKTSFIRCAKLLFAGSGLLEDNKKTPEIFKTITSNPQLLLNGSGDFDGVFNKPAVNQGKNEFFVRFQGVKDGEEFDLKRSFEKSVNNIIIEKLEVQISDKRYSGVEAQETLNSILPKNFIELFFFDGEEIETMIKNINGELRSKIESFLKITSLSYIENALDRNRRDITNKNIKDNELQKNFKEKSSNLATIQDKIAIEKDQIKLYKTEILGITDEINEQKRKQDDIRNDTYKEYEKYQNERNQRESDLKIAKENFKESNIINHIAFLGNYSAIDELEKSIDEFLEVPQKDDIDALKRLSPEMQNYSNKYGHENIAKFIDDFIEFMKNKKIMDKQISTKDIEAIKDKIAKLNNLDLAKYINNIKEKKLLLNECIRYQDDFQTDTSANEKIEIINRDIEEKENELNEYNEQLNKSENDLRQYEIEENRLDIEIKGLEQKIDTERSESELKIIEVLKNNIQEYKKKLIEQLRKDLQKEIIEKYQNITRDDNVQNIDISEEFVITLKDAKFRPININSQSSGQKQLLAIAIFWALSSISNNKTPLIIDTPLARIDKGNRKKIIQNYYKQDKQIIVLPLDTDMDREEYEYAKDNIANIYQITNDEDRGHAKIKETLSIENIFNKE